MKTYVITVSRFFPGTHLRRGEPTHFVEKILKGSKIHTIRSNFSLWRQRFNEIEKGNACLSLRYWSDKPFRSKQIEFTRLTKDDGVGMQRLMFENGEVSHPFIQNGFLKTPLTVGDLALNDCLSLDDFREWFLDYDLDGSLGIIHFTKFRY